MPPWLWAPRAAPPMPALHLPAMAHEAGIRFTMDDVVEIMRRTPYIADLKPGGKYVALDVHRVGGIPVMLKALLDAGLLHGDCLTVTGKTLAENLKDVVFPTDQDVIYPVSKPISPTGGVVGLRGNLAPDGAIVKVAGMHKLQLRRHCALLRFRGGGLRRRAEPRLQGGRRDRHPLRGSEGRPGHARDAVHDGGHLRPGHGRAGGADHRRPLLRRHARLLHRPCRAGSGGWRPDRAAAQRRPDRHRRENGTIDAALSDAELAARRAAWQPRRTDYNAGAIWKFAQLVGPAHLGAVTHPGAESETHCYADI